MCRRDRSLTDNAAACAGLESNDGGRGLRSLVKAALPFDTRARTVARVAIAILVVLLAAWVARDFLVALTWAAVIAIAVWPIYIRFAISVLGGRSPAVAPLLFTFLTGLVLLVPIALAVHQIAQGQRCFCSLAQSTAAERNPGSTRPIADCRRVS
jgi:hypothetical protein